MRAALGKRVTGSMQQLPAPAVLWLAMRVDIAPVNLVLLVVVGNSSDRPKRR